MIEFSISGLPVGKARARVTRFGSYTPAANVNAENHIGLAAAAAMKGQPPMAGPVSMRLVSRFPVPASWGNKKRIDALAGLMQPTKKPDCDNIGKLCADACNGIVYGDDAQIVRMEIVKTYAEMPGLTAYFEAA